MAAPGNGVLNWALTFRMGRVNKKIALVTGGASGLGFAIARRLHDEGAEVVITDIDRDKGQTSAEKIGVSFLPHDVSSEEEWVSLIEQVKSDFGRLDILVNNAGISGDIQETNPEETSVENWEKVNRVNGRGVFLGCKHAVSLMRKSGGGSIINMSSIAAISATPFITPYGYSKAGVMQLTRSVASHCAQTNSNIRCNSVHPGQIRTDLHDALLRETAEGAGAPLEDIENAFKARIPLGKFGEADDIANMVLFLASDEASYITGAKFIVDGGMDLNG